MKRYEEAGQISNMEEEASGPWVTYEDAQAAIQAAVVAEREACAKLCESGADRLHPTVAGHVMRNFGPSGHLASAIRARSTP